MAAAIKETVSNLLHGHSDNTPRQPSPEEFQQLQQKYTDAGQGHVFKFVDQLNQVEKAQLFHQLSNFDPNRINELADKVLNPAKTQDGPVTLEPLPEVATASIMDSDPKDIQRWYDEGLQAVSENKVAVVLMAGGQGTRLGSSAPKGCFDIGLPSQKSLFQIQAERIAKLQLLAQGTSGKEAVIPWYVMTSGPTRKPTEEFFEQHKYFGLDKKNVVIFEQGVLPCISNEGKILLETKFKAAVAPDGNGGIYQALITSGVREDMRKRGIEHIHTYCVDNCLVKVADPIFIGFAASKKVDIATKVVRKRNATESVGLILQKNGKPDVVEYSEIDKETAEAKDPKQPDVLKFRAANIVNHYYSFRFFESIETWSHKLPHHVAPQRYQVGAVLFDVFPLTPLEKFASIEVRREDEFSPLKNARGTGEDDPDTSKRDIMNQGQRWIEKAGGVVVTEGEAVGVEVSPLISYGGEGLEFLKGREIKAPAVIEKEE
ncbi:UDP-N-acetylglucosamine pyrophosphorylase [Aspergillus arachidicola]|uniref:UDP-N-acetylglucosamine diphosphorylase n=1 Tax=Aspergillus arachidicola TaxID=656916 RepID=A0A2G7FZN6_9EURO|nr:UDP-N-acetylglucosamine pyrophosphorylase [Aspergillus arachidicola]